MLLLFFFGCATLAEDHCESADRTVPDDEVLDFGASIADLFADLHPGTVDAVDLSGTTHRIDVSVARAEGDAQLADGEVVEEVTRPGGPGKNITWEGDTDLCGDWIEVPIALTVVSEDGTISVSGSGTLGNVPPAGDSPVLVADHALTDADVLPDGLHGARVAGRVRATWTGGRVQEVRAETTAEDGASEIVLWYQRR